MPVCTLINLAILPFMEGWALFFELACIGPFIFLSNTAIAFGLNIAAIFLIGTASGLVLMLASVFKVCVVTTCHHVSAPTWLFGFTSFLSSLQDILLITGSVLIFGSPITPLQVFGLCFMFASTTVFSQPFFFLSSCDIGYSIALGGLVLFKTTGGK
jgi:hypothetical protein